MGELFSEDDRQRIAAAINKAEAPSDAEIVPYVTVRSDDYPAVRWRGGVLGALITVALAALLREASLPFLAPYLGDGIVLAAALFLGLLGAFTAGALPPLTRILTTSRERNRMVFRRALQAFVEEHVFATRNRTGILLFVSLLEHRIEVLADEGIDRKVDETAWMDVTDHIRRGIEEDRLTQGLLNGIDCCGRLLEEHGVESAGKSDNELSDHLRREDAPDG